MGGGMGGGIDVLLSARRVGPTGKAYGLDMTDEMLDLARQNQSPLHSRMPPILHAPWSPRVWTMWPHSGVLRGRPTT
jgi:hypothetical protein